MGPWEAKGIVKAALPKDCPSDIAEAVFNQLEARVRDMLNVAKGRIDVHKGNPYSSSDDDSSDLSDEDCRSGVQ